MKAHRLRLMMRDQVDAYFYVKGPLEIKDQTDLLVWPLVTGTLLVVNRRHALFWTVEEEEEVDIIEVNGEKRVTRHESQG